MDEITMKDEKIVFS